jgi:hypothetical protein
MSASFTINLDTTSPIISIFSPTYTTLHATAEITIQANEILADIQNIFIVDIAGTRVDLTFNYLGDKYVGTIDFSSLQIGTATIYAIHNTLITNETIIDMQLSEVEQF